MNQESSMSNEALVESMMSGVGKALGHHWTATEALDVERAIRSALAAGGAQEALLPGLPVGTTHITVDRVSRRPWGKLEFTVSALKCEGGTLKLFRTDSDDDYPSWREADSFYKKLPALLPVCAAPSAPIAAQEAVSAVLYAESEVVEHLVRNKVKFYALHVSAEPCGTYDAPLYLAPSAPLSLPAEREGLANWGIDTSTERRILVYKNCSVIEDEQADLVLSLLAAAPTPPESSGGELVGAVNRECFGCIEWLEGVKVPPNGTKLYALPTATAPSEGGER